jgi:hypothetical protein
MVFVQHVSDMLHMLSSSSSSDVLRIQNMYVQLTSMLSAAWSQSLAGSSVVNPIAVRLMSQSMQALSADASMQYARTVSTEAALADEVVARVFSQIPSAPC